MKYLLLIVAVVFFACANMPGTSFIGDDVGRIVQKAAVFAAGPGAAVDLMPDRSVMMATIWLNYFFGELNPVGYKLTNILIHLLSAFSVFFLFKELLRRIPNRERLACAIACIFAAHPINNQAVMSVIQRGVAMSTLFALLSFLFLIYHVTRAARPYYLLSLLCFLLAITSKPNTAILPVMLALYLYSELKLDRKKILTVIFPYLIILAIPLLFYTGLEVNAQSNTISGLDYFLVQSKVVAFYFQKYLLPLDLHFYYDFNNNPKDFIDTSTPFFVSFHVLAIAIAVYRYVKHNSLAALGVIFGYLAFIPESGFFAIYHPAFDHRNYFPMIFFASSLAILISQLAKSQKKFVSVASAVVLPLALLNLNYTSKINTYEKWVFYNFEMNPTYRPHYLYSIAVAFQQSDFALASKLIAAAKEKNPKDTELDFLHALENFKDQRKEEKLVTLERTIDYACRNRLTLEVLYYFENLLNKNLPELTDPKSYLYKMNRLYFTYLPTIFFNLTDPQLQANAKNNFVAVIDLNGRTQPDPKTFFAQIEPIDALISLRNLIALKYYYGYEFDESEYEKILRIDYRDNAEAQTILGWLKTLPKR